MAPLEVPTSPDPLAAMPLLVAPFRWWWNPRLSLSGVEADIVAADRATEICKIALPHFPNLLTLVKMDSWAPNAFFLMLLHSLECRTYRAK